MYVWMPETVVSHLSVLICCDGKCMVRFKKNLEWDDSFLVRMLDGCYRGCCWKHLPINITNHHHRHHCCHHGEKRNHDFVQRHVFESCSFSSFPVLTQQLPQCCLAA